MWSFFAKAAFSGLMVALIATVARRHPGWGGLLASLPLTSILAVSLLWVDTGDRARVAALSHGIMLYIVPSLPLFLVLPALLRTELGFWAVLAISVAMTLALYAAAFWLAPRLGVRM